jgi:hypothetical protein
MINGGRPYRPPTRRDQQPPGHSSTSGYITKCRCRTRGPPPGELRERSPGELRERRHIGRSDLLITGSCCVYCYSLAGSPITHARTERQGQPSLACSPAVAVDSTKTTWCARPGCGGWSTAHSVRRHRPHIDVTLARYACSATMSRRWRCEPIAELERGDADERELVDPAALSEVA